MGNVRFIGDLHLGHRNMASRRKFQDEFYHDEFIIDQWNRVVNKKDVTYILGDITMETDKHYYRLDALRGRKYVILGNHDDRRNVPELMRYVDGIAGMINYKGNIILTHCPIHPCELQYRYTYNIHGHVHENYVMRPQPDAPNGLVRDERYINVSAEVINYTPKLLTELIQ